MKILLPCIFFPGKSDIVTQSIDFQILVYENLRAMKKFSSRVEPNLSRKSCADANTL